LKPQVTQPVGLYIQENQVETTQASDDIIGLQLHATWSTRRQVTDRLGIQNRAGCQGQGTKKQSDQDDATIRHLSHSVKSQGSCTNPRVG